MYIREQIWAEYAALTAFLWSLEHTPRCDRSAQGDEFSDDAPDYDRSDTLARETGLLLFVFG